VANTKIYTVCKIFLDVWEKLVFEDISREETVGARHEAIPAPKLNQPTPPSIPPIRPDTHYYHHHCH
jgi:hypothetical protein